MVRPVEAASENADKIDVIVKGMLVLPACCVAVQTCCTALLTWYSLGDSVWWQSAWLTSSMYAVSNELAKILDCGVSQEQLSTLLQFLKQGEHPEALVALVNKHRDKHMGQSEYPSWAE